MGRLWKLTVIMAHLRHMQAWISSIIKINKLIKKNLLIMRVSSVKINKLIKKNSSL